MPVSSVSRIALAATSALLVLAAFEGLARIFYDAPWYEQLEAEQDRSQRLNYRLNKMLLRDQLPSSPKLSKHRRILVLGDSFTFGLGLRDDETIFPRILERRLSQAPPLPGVERVDVLNAGRPGSLSADWLLLWDELHETFQPDLLLIVFFLRDGTLSWSNPQFFDRIREELVVRNRQSALYQASALYRVIRDGLDRRQLAAEYTRDFQDAYFGNEEQTAEWRRAQRNLRELRDRARASGASTGFVVYPVLAGLDDDYPFAAICELLVDFGEREGFATFSLLPTFMGRRGPELWVSPFDQHPNERAHAITAEALLPFVTKLLKQVESERPSSALP